ncbi:MAG: peptide chain release factor N(5)-glutamine methyltransferase [Clostridiales bacterium]|nr:peptide chain release factor N(5)-glutamine methyltransferase [Clostridiales bacterium]MDD7387674.1 peptide chain release factor N(5)-glutamine methyltransferase [Bacillota bacterium]MDY6041437.1 peptide chain release factor N(5)-glutamine methyltransferase [Candidatus Faecousia sp.]
MVKKYSELYLSCRRALMATEDGETAGLMARNLLSFYTGKTQESLLSNLDLYAGDDVCASMEAATNRLLKGEPLPYILGEWEFYGLTLYVNKNVLIPRDDTCAVVSLAINQAIFLPSDPRVLDLCTGSGCIGLALATRIKDARVTLADISKDALAVAKKNMMAHRLSGRVSCVQADALGSAPAFLGKFDMIVSNPPYVTGPEMAELPDSVKNFEPHIALYGGRDGLDFYRSIAKNYAAALKPGGYLCLEFGMGQGDDVCRILEDNGYTILERAKDFNERERAVLAQYGRKED